MSHRDSSISKQSVINDVIGSGASESYERVTNRDLLVYLLLYLREGAVPIKGVYEYPRDGAVPIEGVCLSCVVLPPGVCLV
jgi:hypothetical protein